MKLSMILLLVGLMQVTASVYSQTTKLSVAAKNQKIVDVLKSIEDQSEFRFFYKNEQVDVNRMVNVDAEDKSVEEILNNVFEGTDITYKFFEDKLILLSSKGTLGSEMKSLQAQQKSVTGKITDEKGEPLPGVTVIIKGTTNGTVTNFDGEYTLSGITPESVLHFSFVGMVPQEIEVGNQSSINITMKLDAIGIEEIVAIGYGQQKKVNLTGAISSVKADKISRRSVTSATKAFQGLAPGLTIIDRGGMVGTDESIISIRGISSFKGNNYPLVIIDGVEQSISDINTNDIENVSVLKDAASTAIYGNRAAAGVILITTKRGKEEGLKISYQGAYGWNKATKMPEKVGISDYMTLYNEAYTNVGQPAPFSEKDIENTVKGLDPYRYPNTDWQDLLFKTSVQHNHTINATGGNKKIKFNMSLNYTDQDGVLKMNNSMKRYGIRVNTDYQISDKLSAAINFNTRRKVWVEPMQTWAVFWNLYHDMPPWGLAKLADGRYGTSTTGNNNLAKLENGKSNKVQNYVMFSGRLSYEIIKGLTLTGEYANTYTDNDINKIQNRYALYNYDGTWAKWGAWRNEQQYTNSQKYIDNWKAIVEYEKSLQSHKIKALLGVEKFSEKNIWAGLGRFDSYNNKLTAISAGKEDTQWTYGNNNELKTGSVFGRLNYGFQGKYLFEANFRHDGSSKFGEGNTRWGTFPSFSAGYRISEERFMKSFKWLHNLKIRASWGQTGRQEGVGYWKYYSNIKINDVYAFGESDASVMGAYQENLGNTDITWETTNITDIGLDLNILKDKLGLTFDYYKKVTDDLLNDHILLPRSLGFGSQVVNKGKVENKGWELSIHHQNMVGKHFKYSVLFNISDNKNKVLEFSEIPHQYSYYIIKEGLPIDALWGYKTDGFFNSQEEVDAHAFQYSGCGPGDLRYINQNDDNIINDDDKLYLGDSQPHLPVSLNIDLNYKNWDIGMYWQGVLKQNVVLSGALADGPNWGNFTHKEMLGRWTPETKEIATWPRLTKGGWRNQDRSDFWIRDAKYVRLKNIQLGYTLPRSVLNKLKVEKVRLYVSADNILTFSPEKLIDPEFKPGRVDYHPQMKMWLVGFNVNF